MNLSIPQIFWGDYPPMVLAYLNVAVFTEVANQWQELVGN